MVRGSILRHERRIHTQQLAGTTLSVVLDGRAIPQLASAILLNTRHTS